MFQLQEKLKSCDSTLIILLAPFPYEIITLSMRSFWKKQLEAGGDFGSIALFYTYESKMPNASNQHFECSDHFCIHDCNETKKQLVLSAQRDYANTLLFS